MTDTPRRNPLDKFFANKDSFELWTDVQREESLAGSLAELKEVRDIWIFGYGSLIWHPEIDFEESRPARLDGYHRSLCLWSTVNRGTPEQPGLVFGLDNGGSCEGRVFRLPNENLHEQLRVLWRRELPNSSYIPRWLQCQTPEGPVQALVFVMDRDDHSYTGDLTPEETRDIVLNAHGDRGPCVEYVLQTEEALKAAGIKDESLTELCKILRT